MPIQSRCGKRAPIARSVWMPAEPLGFNFKHGQMGVAADARPRRHVSLVLQRGSAIRHGLGGKRDQHGGQ
jgi:hypothetical protein